ncbi:MAG: hypothetical protein QF659_00700, partial [Dehalococcoidia bacterium]|nr:hypothetical protein [Dehalococcoidia bacterium]
PGNVKRLVFRTQFYIKIISDNGLVLLGCSCHEQPRDPVPTPPSAILCAALPASFLIVRRRADAPGGWQGRTNLEAANEDMPVRMNSEKGRVGGLPRIDE